MIKKILLGVTLCLVLVAAPTWARDWHVRPSGGDYGSEDGTSKENAWDGFSNIVWGAGGDQAGDALYLYDDDGDYRKQLTIGASGSEGNPITIKAADGESPVINGADLATGWEQHSGNIYKATVTTNPVRLVVYNNTVLTHNDGHKDSLGENEWDWDSNVLYVNVGEDPDNGILESGVRLRGVYSNGKSYINLENISVKNAKSTNMEFKKGSHIRISNVTSLRAGYDGMAFGSITNSMIEDCVSNYNRDNGVYLRIGSTDNILNRVTASNNGGGNTQGDQCGIGMGGMGGPPYGQCHRNQVLYCVVQNNVGIGVSFWESDDCIVKGCEISNNEIGIQFSSADNGMVTRSYIYDNDKEGVFAFGSSWKNLKIQYNIITSSGDEGVAIGGSSNFGNVYVENNTFYANTIGLWNGGTQSAGSEYIRNNIFYITNKRHKALKVTTPARIAESNHNCFHNTQTNGKLVYWDGTTYTNSNFNQYQTDTGRDANSIISDPQFVNTSPTEVQHCKLKDGSACINNGNDVGLVKDFLGNSVPRQYIPDIGAIEFYMLMSPTNLRIIK